VSSPVKAGIDAVAHQPMIAMLIGSAIAPVWCGSGGALARAHGRIETGSGRS
jgi:hypothetical protein